VHQGDAALDRSTVRHRASEHEADPLRADFRRELDRLYAAVESSDEA